MDLAPSLSPNETITANLRLILRGVLAVLGMWRLENPQKILLYRRLIVTFQGIERLLVRFRAGKLRRVERQVTGQKRVDGGLAGRGPALPRRFGWLVQAGGHQAAGYGSQLKAVLSTPEMVELLAVSPQAVRIMRPLCRALGMELPWVRGEARKIRARKPRKQRPEPEPFRYALPRGVLTWARREKALENALKRVR